MGGLAADDVLDIRDLALLRLLPRLVLAETRVRRLDRSDECDQVGPQLLPVVVSVTGDLDRARGRDQADIGGVLQPDPDRLAEIQWPDLVGSPIGRHSGRFGE